MNWKMCSTAKYQTYRKICTKVVMMDWLACILSKFVVLQIENAYYLFLVLKNEGASHHLQYHEMFDRLSNKIKSYKWQNHLAIKILGRYIFLGVFLYKMLLWKGFLIKFYINQFNEGKSCPITHQLYKS